MASSTSSSNHGSQSIRVPTKNCFCGIPARVEVARSTQNSGRIYYNCRYWPNGCRFYDWLIPRAGGEGGNPIDAGGSIDIADVSQLEARIAMVQKSIKEMKFYVFVICILCVVNCLCLALYA